MSALRQNIYSGRSLGWKPKLARLRAALPAALGGLLLVLAFPLMLAACSGYNDIRDAANDIRLDGSITFPTQVPYTGTALLPVTAPSPQPDQQAIPGTIMDPCLGAEWWQAGIYKALGDAIKAGTKNTMLGGFSVFSTAIGSGAIPVEDNVVMGMTSLAAGLVTGLWPLALLWAVLRSGSGKILGSGGGDGVLKNMGRIGFVIFLATPQAGDAGPPIAYLMAIPMLICNAVFRVLITAAISGWTNLTAYSGIFNIDATCNGTGLLLLALLAIIIAVLLFLMAVVLWIRTGALYLNFAVAPFVLAGWMFDVDELRSYMGQFLSRYSTLVFGIVPVGVGFVLMNGFVLAPTSDVGQSARHLIMATVTIFLMIMLLQRSLGGTTMMVLNRVRSVPRLSRRAFAWARSNDTARAQSWAEGRARRARQRELNQQIRLETGGATAAFMYPIDTMGRRTTRSVATPRDVNANRPTAPMPSVLAEQPPLMSPTKRFPGVPTLATMPTAGPITPQYPPNAPTLRNLPPQYPPNAPTLNVSRPSVSSGATGNGHQPSAATGSNLNISTPAGVGSATAPTTSGNNSPRPTTMLAALPTPPPPPPVAAPHPTPQPVSGPAPTFAPLLADSWDEAGDVSVSSPGTPAGPVNANGSPTPPAVGYAPTVATSDDVELTPLAVVYEAQVRPRQPLPPLPVTTTTAPMPLPTPDAPAIITPTPPHAGVSQADMAQALAEQSRHFAAELQQGRSAVLGELQAEADATAAVQVDVVTQEGRITQLERRRQHGGGVTLAVNAEGAAHRTVSLPPVTPADQPPSPASLPVPPSPATLPTAPATSLVAGTAVPEQSIAAPPAGVAVGQPTNNQAPKPRRKLPPREQLRDNPLEKAS